MPCSSRGQGYLPIPLLAKTDQDQGGSGGGGRHRPQWAEEVLVPPSLPDGMREPLLAPGWDLLSQHLPGKDMLYHTDLETLQLTDRKLSGMPSRTKGFQMQLSR